MSKTQLNVLFKKIQKDDKKEVLEFHVQGDELPYSQELVGMAVSIVYLDVETSKVGKINAEFKSIQRDSKKTTLKFNVKGDSEEKMNKLYPFAGRSVLLNKPHEGVEYTIEKDGTTKVAANQMSLEDVKDKSEVQVEPDEEVEVDPFAAPDFDDAQLD